MQDFFFYHLGGVAVLSNVLFHMQVYHNGIPFIDRGVVTLASGRSEAGLIG